MIISDLGYFEEVVAEAPSILGGVQPSSAQLAWSSLNQFPVTNVGPVTTVSQATPNGAASSTVIQFTVGNQPGQTAASTSTSR